MPRDVPVHIGLIMDGNSRWAALKGYKKERGYTEGLKSAKLSVRAAVDIGVQYLTFYTFSTENWNRPQGEIDFLFSMIAKRLRAERAFYKRYGVRVLHSGSVDGLPSHVMRAIDAVRRETEHHKNITVNLAINYGGRDEIVRAIQRWQRNGASDSPFTSETMQQYLDIPSLPDPDLIIRTGGEHRLSNFLVWECAYSEFYFSSTLWPDWTTDHMRAAVDDFRVRKRNFGGARQLQEAVL